MSVNINYYTYGLPNYCNTCPSDIRGLCCWDSKYNGKEHVATEPCKYLNKAGRCTIYKKRYEIKPECKPPTILNIKQGSYPENCPYVVESGIIPDIPYKKRLIY